MPVRIQRSRQHKQESPNGLPIVYVGRPSKWGNPYPKAGYGEENAIGLYEIYVEKELDNGTLDIEELRGKNLSCWCRLDRNCHADVLLKILANHSKIKQP